MRAVVHMAAFLELSDDNAVDPDVAVKQLESLAFELQQLAPDGREALITFVLREAEQAEGEYREFLLGFPEALGLVES